MWRREGGKRSASEKRAASEEKESERKRRYNTVNIKEKKERAQMPER